MFEVINRNSRKKCDLCSKLTIKASERHHWLLMFLLLILNIFTACSHIFLLLPGNGLNIQKRFQFALGRHLIFTRKMHVLFCFNNNLFHNNLFHNNLQWKKLILKKFDFKEKQILYEACTANKKALQKSKSLAKKQ